MVLEKYVFSRHENKLSYFSFLSACVIDISEVMDSDVPLNNFTIHSRVCNFISL